jgi:hypothetical protein
VQRVRITPVDDDHLAAVPVDDEPATATILDTFENEATRARRALEAMQIAHTR